MDLGLWGNPCGIPQGINGCLLSEAVLLTKPEVAEGCAARVMVIVSEESCDKSREGSRARSRGNETRDHVTELRVRDDGMAVLKSLKFLSAEEP
jgi:hypothetical protein